MDFTKEDVHELKETDLTKIMDKIFETNSCFQVK